MRTHSILIASLVLSMALAQARPAPAADATRPDLAGVWMVQQAYYLGHPLLPAPKLTAPVLAQKAKLKAAQTAGYVREAAGMLCGQNGGPNMYQVRSPFEIFSGFGRMTLIFETEMNNQPRTIYMDEKVQPANIYPSYNGHSIGHWDGPTLVVDTTGFTPRGRLIGDIPRTAQTHTVERFDLSSNGKVLAIQLTVEDPSSLTEPWTTTLKFDREPRTEERFEVWCDADLEAFKTLDLNALKDADPEVARLLDGDNTDPAVTLAKSAGK